MAPKLTQVNIAVRDMDAMAAFYERLGLSMAVGHPDWAAHHRSASGDDAPDVELDSVAFTSWWNEGWAANSGGTRYEDQSPARRSGSPPPSRSPCGDERNAFARAGDARGASPGDPFVYWSSVG